MVEESKPKRFTRSRKKEVRTGPSLLEVAPQVKELSSWPCKRCLQFKPLKEYYIATDPIEIQGTGHMSLCRDCIEALYNKYYSSEGSMEKAILKICRIVNCRYDSSALETLRKHIATAESKGKAVSGAFGIYRRGLIKAGDHGFASNDSEDLTFQEGVKYEVINALPEDFEASEYLKEFWGVNLDYDDYSFLEREFAKFKETHKADTYAEKVLLKLVCFKLLEIQKCRIEEIPTTSKEKELQELMKNLAISPQYAKAVDEGKNLDAFGVWIAEIEQEEPAQWLESDGKKYDMYRDVADVEGYFQKYFVRPLRNAIMQSKDFNVEDDVDEFEEYDITEGLNDGEESQTLSE